MKTFEEKLNDYAKLISEVGIGCQKGNKIMIRTSTETIEFARLIVKNLYELGAEKVVVDISDESIIRMNFENESKESLSEVPDYIVQKAKYAGEEGYGRISITGGNPELLKGIDSEKIEASNRAFGLALKDTMKYTMNDIVSWCVAGASTKAWAKKVFPDLDEEEAVRKLWEKIFFVTRMDEDDPVQKWRDHLDTMAKHADWLNEMQFDRLIYKSSNGTNLTVGLPKGHKFIAGDSKNAKGQTFIANIPTEEVFSCPDCRRIDGKLVATKPLSYGGNIIDNFSFEFKDGKVVSFKAEVGEEVLKDMLNQGEGANTLGEIALVPYDSPINNSKVLFYNTLLMKMLLATLHLEKLIQLALKMEKICLMKSLKN